MKKDIGIGANAPEKSCQDLNCPWHGKLSIRGKALEGKVVSSKTSTTAIIERGYPKFVPKYQGYERRKSRITAHNPPCIHARDGETVLIAECRPLSKTKSFVVVSKNMVKE